MTMSSWNRDTKETRGSRQAKQDLSPQCFHGRKMDPNTAALCPGDGWPWVLAVGLHSKATFMTLEKPWACAAVTASQPTCRIEKLFVGLCMCGSV
jgi:hypothetical protein